MGIISSIIGIYFYFYIICMRTPIDRIKSAGLNGPFTQLQGD